MTAITDHFRHATKMVANGELRPLPDGWRWARLGDVCEEVTQGVGATWNEFRLVGATRDGIAPAKDPVGKNPRRYKPVLPGTVFYNPMRILLQSIAMIDVGEEPGITSPDYVVFRGRDGMIHHRYIYEWLRSSAGDVFIRSLARGAVRERILYKRLEEGSIPVPPWEWQQRFANQMAHVARARAAAEERLTATYDLPRAILGDAFENPDADNWQEHRLGDLLHRHNEIIHPGDRASGDAEFVGLEHIEAHTGRRIGSLTIDLGNLTGRKPTFRKGHIVYGYLRPYLNKVWIAEFDGCSSVDQFAFEVRHPRADLIAAFMRSPTFLRRSKIMTTTGQLPRIGIDEIMAVAVELPRTPAKHNHLADKIKRRIAESDRIRIAAETELAKIDSLPATLLRNAFRGDS